MWILTSKRVDIPFYWVIIYMNKEYLAIDNPIIAKVEANNPLYNLNEREFNKGLMTFGSFVSIIKNKRINHTMLLIFLLEDNNYRECFKEISGVDNTKLLLYNFIQRFPNLCKSKIIKTKIKKLHKNGKYNRTKII